MFLVEGRSPLEVARELAVAEVAVWDGHNYAVEAMVPLGLDAEEGACPNGENRFFVHLPDERLFVVLPHATPPPGSVQLPSPGQWAVIRTRRMEPWSSATPRHHEGSASVAVAPVTIFRAPRGDLLPRRRANVRRLR